MSGRARLLLEQDHLLEVLPELESHWRPVIDETLAWLELPPEEWELLRPTRETERGALIPKHLVPELLDLLGIPNGSDVGGGGAKSLQPLTPKTGDQPKRHAVRFPTDGGDRG
jgi:hypothetical protein